MKINDVFSINAVSNIKKAGRKNKGGSEFAGMIEENDEVTSINNTQAASNISSLLLLQEVEDIDYDGQSKQKGNQILEHLEEIRLGLLTGQLSKNKLLELQNMVKQNLPRTNNADINNILNEIEVLAAVELAKLGM